MTPGLAGVSGAPTSPGGSLRSPTVTGGVLRASSAGGTGELEGSLLIWKRLDGFLVQTGHGQEWLYCLTSGVRGLTSGSCLHQMQVQEGSY
jgi:hypothetical protein